MDIKIYHLIEGARKAQGLTVIIDVFRAFSTACYIFQNGAERIFPVGDLEKALKLKKENPEYILVGERDGKKLPQCDFGNSPAEVEKENFDGKEVIHTTSAGTQGIVKAKKAAEIITGSFVNAEAIVKYILNRQPEKVSLVAMGKAGKNRVEEDIYCAEYIKNKLKGNKLKKFYEIKKELRQGSGSQFFDPAQNWFKKRDFELSLKLNKFNFILQKNLYSPENSREKLICLTKKEIEEE